MFDKIITQYLFVNSEFSVCGGAEKKMRFVKM